MLPGTVEFCDGGADPKETTMNLLPLRHLLGYSVILVLASASGAQALPGTGTVDSGDIKNGQVKRIDLANDAVNSAKVAPNAITGADVAEATLGTVPNAGKVDGLDAARFMEHITVLPETAPVKVAAVGGLEIWAGCNEDVDNLDHYAWLEARSSVADAYVSLTVNIASSVTTIENADLDPLETQTIVSSSFSPGTATLTYSTPTGRVVTGQFGFSGIGNNSCYEHGMLFGG